LYDIALEHLDQENYGQAIISIERYVDENPENKNGKLLMAVIYGDLSNYTKVLEILSTISPTQEESPDYAKVYYVELGDTHREMGNFAEAIKYYDMAIEAVPYETVGHIMKGCCLASIGKYEDAKTEHLKAAKLVGDPEEAFYNLALIARAEKNFDKAKEYCEKSLEIDPDDIKVMHFYKDVLDSIDLEKKANRR